MRKLRNLIGILASSAIGLSGCANDSQSVYRINDADVTLLKKSYLISNTNHFLTVARGDTITVYTDLDSDLNLNRVEINPNKTGFRMYRKGDSEIADTVLAKAENKFMGYMGKIAEIDKERKEQDKQEALRLIGD